MLCRTTILQPGLRGAHPAERPLRQGTQGCGKAAGHRTGPLPPHTPPCSKPLRPHTCCVAHHPPPRHPPCRCYILQVQFREFKILGLIPVKAPANAAGALEVTYLDEDLRVSRGDKGNLFVLRMQNRRVKP